MRSGDIFGCHSLVERCYWDLVDRERPEMLLNIQCTTNTYLAANVNSAEYDVTY